jgi:hypothetical protein
MGSWSVRMQPTRLNRSPLQKKRGKFSELFKIESVTERNQVIKKKLPEPVDKKDDAEAFAGLVFVIFVKLRQLSDKPASDTQHSEGKADTLALKKNVTVRECEPDAE